MLQTHVPVEIRMACEADVPLILAFIRKLAEYERLAHEMAAGEDDLRKWLFGPQRAAEVALAYSAHEPVGFAVFSTTFSTFRGAPGIYLEDLFVDSEHRGRGTGRALLQYVAGAAVARGFGYLTWSVLDWNQPAIDFYQSLGAVPKDEWTVYRLTGDALKKLASDTKMG
jgi:GNAT superfamily N-acetyltransferase